MRHLFVPALVMALPDPLDIPKKFQDVEYIGELGADWQGLFEYNLFKDATKGKSLLESWGTTFLPD